MPTNHLPRYAILGVLLLSLVAMSTTGCTTVPALAATADPALLEASDEARADRRARTELPLEERIAMIEADLERTLVPVGDGALAPRFITARGRPGPLHLEHNVAILSGLAAKYAVTGDEETKALAERIIRGLLALDALSGELDGFVPIEVDTATFAMADRTSHANIYTQLLFAYALAHAWIGPNDDVLTHVSLIYQRFVRDDFTMRHIDGSYVAKADVGGFFIPFNGRRALDRRLLDCSALYLGDEATRELAEQKRWRGPLLTPLHFRFFNLEFPTPSSSWLNLQAMTALAVLGEPHRGRAVRLANRYRRDNNPLFRLFAMMNGGDDCLSAIRDRLSEYPYPATTSGIINSHRPDVSVGPRAYVKWHSPAETRTPLPLYAIRTSPYLWKQRLRVVDTMPESRPNQLLGHDLFQAYWFLRLVESDSRLAAAQPRLNQ